MTWTKRIVATLLCATLVTTAPAAVFAQDDGSSSFKDLTAEATAAYENGEYENAIELFKKAYEVRSVSNILYNIARIYEDAGDIDGAIEYYDKFVVAPNVDQGPRRDALDRLKTLREVKKMQAGEPEQTQVAETPRPEPDPAPEPNTGRTVGWVFLGVGGASLIGSGIFALLTQSQHDSFATATSLDARRQAANSGRTNAVLADSLLVTGAVTAIVGGVFLIASSGSDTAKSESGTLHVRPIVGRAWGVGLDLDF